MKKILFVFALCSVCLMGCKKEDDGIKITNLTGKDFYDCEVWFYSSAGSMYEAPDIIGYRSVGNLKMGEDCKVEYLGKYCSLEGTDADGHRVYTYKKPAYDEMTFRKSDIASVY